MSNVTRLPPFPKTVHVEADIPFIAADGRWRTLRALRGVRNLWHTPSGTPQRSRERR
jgi:hypothetical protein